MKIFWKLLQLVASDLVSWRRMVNDYLVNRMVDKLMVGGIVFHKLYMTSFFIYNLSLFTTSFFIHYLFFLNPFLHSWTFFIHDLSSFMTSSLFMTACFFHDLSSFMTSFIIHVLHSFPLFPLMNKTAWMNSLIYGFAGFIQHNFFHNVTSLYSYLGME